MHGHGSNWPEAHVELLRKLWPEGRSAAFIASEINSAFPGAGYSRNSVIGKVHRLGLSGRIKPRRSTPFRKPRSQKPLRTAPFNPPFQKPPELKIGVTRVYPASLPDKPLPEEPPPPVDCEPVGIMQLEDDMCRWVISLGPAMYCGAKHVNGTYCTAHAPPGRPREERKSRPRHYTPSYRED